MQQIINKLIKNSIRKNTNFIFNKFFENRIINNNFYTFCFHEITNNPSDFQRENDLHVTPVVFEKQIQFLKKIFRNNKLKILDQNFLITFDDGYHNSFIEGLDILSKQEIKPIYFLNMNTIKNNKPILSAEIIYLGRYSEIFKKFCLKNSIKKPYYLNINSKNYNNYKLIEEFDQNKILIYQGKTINFDFLSKKIDKKKFFVANHLFNHFNCKVLTEENLTEEYKKNKKILDKFQNSINYFALTNGQPSSCFDNDTIRHLNTCDVEYIFSSFGSNYFKNNLIDRLVLNNDDDTEEKVKFKIILSSLKKLIFRYKINFK